MTQAAFPWRLLHGHHWSADCSKDAYLRVMVLRSGTENPQIAPELGLGESKSVR
jgi:hypothetical protein